MIFERWYQVYGEKNAECEAGSDVRPVTDIKSQSVDAVECWRESDRQRQKRTQNVRLVTGRDHVVYVYLSTSASSPVSIDSLYSPE